jgi:OCT family organic cation transporter-like MFS transporter 4/5
MVDFDEILYEIGDFGIYQKIRYLLICLAAMLPAIVTYLHSFTAANPNHRFDSTFAV